MIWIISVLVISFLIFYFLRKNKRQTNELASVEKQENVKYDFVAIDFEYADRNQYACQVGIVPVLNGIIQDKIEYLIQPPGNDYGFFETRVHGINSDTTKNSPDFQMIWDEICKYFEDQVLLCHNSSTDINVLKKSLLYYNINIPKFSVVDTMDVIGKYKLVELAKAYDVEYTNMHNALSDALAVANVYLKHKQGLRPAITIANHYNQDKKSFENNKLKDRDLLKQDLNVEDKNNPFYNKKVVITGVFETMNRDEISSLFKNLGSDVNTTISSKTNYVVIGANAGPSKLNKIEELKQKGCDIKIIAEQDLDDISKKIFVKK